MSEPLHVEVSELAAGHIRAAEAWWRSNRPKAPNAIREELERASSLITVQPGIGTRVSGPWWMAVHLDGKWVRFQMDLGNADHRKAFLEGRVPYNATTASPGIAAGGLRPPLNSSIVS